MRLFIGGSSGLIHFEDEEITKLHSEPVLAAVKLQTGKVVAGTDSGMILVWDGNGDARVVAKDLGDGVHGLAVASNGVIFAGTLPAGVWFSKDSGETWKELPAFPSAPNSENWTAPWGTPLVSGLGTHPKDPKTVFAGVEVGGIYRSRDAGKKWFDLEVPGSDVHSIQVSPAKHERVFVTTGQGSYCSDDEGFNWRQMGQTNPRQYSMGLAAHPAEADRVIISAAEGPPPSWKAKTGARCDIYLSTDAGRRFRTVVKGLRGAVQRRALIINPKVPSEVVFGTSLGEIFYSNDGGESFDREAEKLGDVKAVVFA
ncbi:MAG TPA: hypothetical protein VND22_03570 [Actinomycetota bacterium]|nr:hypothetical protein [Actinomycetota bacterium]